LFDETMSTAVGFVDNAVAKNPGGALPSDAIPIH
jgi:hypothetical protein